MKVSVAAFGCQVQCSRITSNECKGCQKWEVHFRSIIVPLLVYLFGSTTKQCDTNEKLSSDGESA